MELISFLLRVVAFPLLVALPTVNATPAISLPYPFEADKLYDLKIDQKIAPNEEVRKRANAYRVYLALTPPGWGTGPVCWLAKEVDLDVTQVNVTIPADAAPDQSRIRISTALLKKGAPRGMGFSYSSRTTLVGANATWSQKELDGRNHIDAEEVSCWAYGCARTCQVTYYTTKDEEDGPIGDKAYACVKQCAKDLNPRSDGAMNGMSMSRILAVVVMIGSIHMVLGVL
ncbi:uncharacterized protein BKA55DRAFT_563074 [Fusarium redolens]|uniref:Uncharacterized protein n=1 Tax=Fusarium redolens TaxID=48865 RepID=A0A9P9HNK2_FUSRE|nr:uncharacterized protein BKA55DRAFT_563074 [Fusarium redolens]KAH7259704.1 hypothetical protein BKA55DRAFT_563074 [Fusarium redolens]